MFTFSILMPFLQSNVDIFPIKKGILFLNSIRISGLDHVACFGPWDVSKYDTSTGVKRVQVSLCVCLKIKAELVYQKMSDQA